MKKLSFYGLCALLILASSALSAQTRIPYLTVGTAIPQASVLSLTHATPITLGNQTYRIINVEKAEKQGITLPTVIQNGTHTLLVDSNGMVGISRHNVIIKNVSEAGLQPILQTLPIKADHIKIAPYSNGTSLTFQAFQEARDAYRILTQTLPQDSVIFPIQSQRLRAR